MNINNGPAIRESLTVNLHYRNNGERPFGEQFLDWTCDVMAAMQHSKCCGEIRGGSNPSMSTKFLVF